MKLIHKFEKNGFTFLKVEKISFFGLISTERLYQGHRVSDEMMWLSYPDYNMVVGKEKEELNKLTYEVD